MDRDHRPGAAARARGLPEDRRAAGAGHLRRQPGLDLGPRSRRRADRRTAGRGRGGPHGRPLPRRGGRAGRPRPHARGGGRGGRGPRPRHQPDQRPARLRRIPAGRTGRSAHRSAHTGAHRSARKEEHVKTTATVRLDRPITEAAELARRAEDLGFDGVWVADHYFHRDATGALALMAAATERVTLGTAVVSPLLRHPALLASAAATINEISDGRFVLGLGAGGYEFAAELGIPPRRPLGLTAEAVRIVRELYTGRADVTGDTFTTTGELRFTPVPTPVYLAGRGPKMLALAGEIGDGVITHGLSGRHIAYVKEKLGGPGTALVLMLDVEVDRDRARALDALRPRCMAMAGGSYADELIEVYGLDPAEIGALRAALRSGDRAAAGRLVTDQMVDAFGIAGPPELLRDRLAEFAAAGVDEVILSVGGGDLDASTGHLTELAKAVL
ncbi:hypothetical protein DP939_14800 [Spongiactinospora rosea]|uniref:Luciferase-like domain-containing protein n=1 Tax=Spongiactinospora rosea TaxID=2248750 RepID=A0A366LZ10_9ACTN|nr:hypothetical protein DP939_14800 [Spongiactinospora rosea]